MIFRENFKQVIHLLYVAPKDLLHTNGANSQGFLIFGLPSFPTIIALATEPLTQSIRHNLLISRVNIKKKLFKTSLFADYIVICVTDPEKKYLQTIGSTLNEFMEISGLKVNAMKALVYLISLSFIHSHFI